MGQKRLARARGADEQDVRFLDLHIVAPMPATGFDALVVIVDRHGQHLLGVILPHNVIIQYRFDLGGLGHPQALTDTHPADVVLGDDVVAQLDTLVTDVDGGTGY